MPQNQFDQSALSYVALRDMQVNGTTRAKGTAVPEAASWRNLNNYISQGWIGVVSVKTHPGVPSGKATRSRVGKAEGNAEYTHYRPVDPSGLPAKIANDAS